MLWAALTVFAACMQIARTGLQKSLKTSADDYVIAWFRFVFAVPFVPLYLLLLRGLDIPLPAVNGVFWLYVLSAAVAQIIGTLFLVASFSRRNFVVCTALSKTEGLQIALLATAFFGDELSLSAGGAILLGACGLFLFFPRNVFSDDKSVATGIGAGFCFALTALLATRAVNALNADNLFAAAAVVLSAMIILQTVLLGAFLFFRGGNSWKKINWKKGAAVGLTGFLGTVGWITAFALAHPAFVKTLAQIELPLAYLLGRTAFGEKPKAKEIGGIILTALAAIWITVAN